jgi:hypothetical protein
MERRLSIASIVLGVLLSGFGCDKLGIGPTGTCIEPTGGFGRSGICTLNAKEFVCNPKGNTNQEKAEFYKEGGAAGMDRCKALGYDFRLFNAIKPRTT